MNEKKIEHRVLKLFSNHFGIPFEDLKPEFELEKDLNATKLELNDFYSLLESTFEIKIDPQESESLKTVGDLINFIIDHGSFA